MKSALDRIYNIFLSDQTRRRSEKIIISLAIVSFFLHLAVIVLSDYGIISVPDKEALFANPIAAIYTPFSFILLYEAYLLVYYLPKSTTIYIGKQYEIITLIVIRRIFKDLSNLEFTENWFSNPNDLQFTVDLLATIVLFLLIFVFYRINDKRIKKRGEKVLSGGTQRFINRKRGISLFLVPLFLGLAIYSLTHWVVQSFSLSGMVGGIRDVNKVFFDDFFGMLILTDVLLLLISFFHVHKFSAVIRNSGFVISTILIKISFGTEGLLTTLLVVVAVLFGVVILWSQSLYESIQETGEADD